MSYVKVSIGDDTAWGVGEDTDTAKANFDAILSAVGRIPGAWAALDSKQGEPTGFSPLQEEFSRALEQIRSSSSGRTIKLDSYTVGADDGQTHVSALARHPDGEVFEVRGHGCGAIAAFVDGLEDSLGTQIEILDYAQQTLEPGTGASAISVITARAGGTTVDGVAENHDTLRANFEAILDAVGRLANVSEASAHSG